MNIELEDTGKTTRVTAIETIQQVKGSCPKCGGHLELKPHVCAWNLDGSPSKEDTFKEPYCPKCKLFWVGEPE